MYAVERACFGREGWGILEILDALLFSTVHLKAVIKDQVVGVVIGEAQPLQGYGWIATLGVLPEFRRQGIGARLLAAAEAQLAQPRIKLTVRRSNIPAVNLYRRCGYHEIQIWEHYYPDGEDGVVMEKITAATTADTVATDDTSTRQDHS